MAFFRRKAQVRPTLEISWPIERQRGGEPPAPPTSPSSMHSSPSPTSFQSSRRSDASTAATSFTYGPISETPWLNPGACELEETDDYFEQLQDALDISDDCPTAEVLEEAGNVPIYDSEGNSRPFSSLYSGMDALGDQQLVIFVRHFYCGACQAYLRALSKAITLKTYFTLPVPTSITVIGLGSPDLISSYRHITGTPFPIYADPTRRLYKALGMSWTLRAGPRCDYMKGINRYNWIKGQVDQVLQEEKSLRPKGGNILWVGGEFMFKGGEAVWCKRMKTYRGHSEIAVIRRLLGVED